MSGVANEGKKITTYGDIEQLNDGGSFVVIQKDGENEKLKLFPKDKFKEQFPGTVSVPVLTKAQMQDLIDFDQLKTGNKYIISDATAAQIGLMVTAASVNTVHSEAISADYPEDIIYYRFELDLITARFDPINNISAGQDWRNSENITIGENCKNIYIGTNSTGSIGANGLNINIGDNTQFEIGVGCVSISFGDNANGDGCKIGDNAERIYIGDFSSCDLKTGSVDFTLGGSSNAVGIFINSKVGSQSNVYQNDGYSVQFVGVTIGNSVLFATSFNVSSVIIDDGVYMEDIIFASVSNKHFKTSGDFSNTDAALYSISSKSTIEENIGGEPLLVYFEGGVQKIVEANGVV